MENSTRQNFDRNYVVAQLVDILNQIIEEKEAENISASFVKEVA